MEGFKEAQSTEEVREHIDNEELAFVFVYGENCSVCHAIMPLIKPIVDDYEEVNSLQINRDKHPSISGELTVLTVPVLLLFVNGKESMRFARFVEVDKVREQLDKITQAIKG